MLLFLPSSRVFNVLVNMLYNNYVYISTTLGTTRPRTKPELLNGNSPGGKGQGEPRPSVPVEMGVIAEERGLWEDFLPLSFSH